MRSIFLSALLAVLLAGGSVFAQGDYVEFQRILDTKCSRCHTRARIEQAMQRGENFDEIMAKMVRLGAKLSNKERQVLGVFWAGAPRTPAAMGPKEKPIAEDPLGEYRAVLENRCTRCHSLDRVEEAMKKGRSLDDLLEMMEKRGAIVSEADKSVLGTFWGQPFRQKSTK